jgi:hypothetical protein
MTLKPDGNGWWELVGSPDGTKLLCPPGPNLHQSAPGQPVLADFEVEYPDGTKRWFSDRPVQWPKKQPAAPSQP